MSNTVKKTVSAFQQALEDRSREERVFTSLSSEEKALIKSAVIVENNKGNLLCKLILANGKSSKFLLDYDCPADAGDRLAVNSLKVSPYEDTFIITGRVL